MADDVVELARDARALLRHGLPGLNLPLSLEQRRALLRLGRLREPVAERVPRQPRGREHERDEQEVGSACVRVLADDDRRGAEHDGQAREPLAAGR